jgi:hypothetical protein
MAILAAPEYFVYFYLIVSNDLFITGDAAPGPAVWPRAAAGST